jgi:hypothetical protein
VHRAVSRPPGHLPAVIAFLALAVVAALTWDRSGARLSSEAGSSANGWQAATVAVSDDDVNTAAFTASGLRPGNVAVRCVTVTYAGDVAADVRLYATPGTYGGTLGPYVDLLVEEGTGGSFADCSAFTRTSVLHDGTLAAFAAHADYASGVGTFAPGAAGAQRVYRFTYALREDAGAVGLAGLTATLGFTWQARAS